MKTFKYFPNLNSSNYFMYEILQKAFDMYKYRCKIYLLEIVRKCEQFILTIYCF